MEDGDEHDYSGLGPEPSGRLGRFLDRPRLALWLVASFIALIAYRWNAVPAIVEGSYSRWWDAAQISALVAYALELAVLVLLLAWGIRQKGWVPSLTAVGSAFALCFYGLVLAVTVAVPEFAGFPTLSTSSGRIASCARHDIDADANRQLRLDGERFSCRDLEEHGLLCNDGSLLMHASGITFCAGGESDGGREGYPVATAPDEDPQYRIGF